MKYVSYLLGGLTAAAAAAYSVVYLTRWEWQRALICGVLLLVVEVLLGCAVLLSRIGRLEHRVADTGERTEEVWRRLRESGDEQDVRFRWLESREPDGAHRTYVFVPVLMVAGVLLSGVAWVVQRISAATARPGAERRLAGRLAPLAAPPRELIGRAPELEDRPAVPAPRTARVLILTAVVAACGLLLALLVDTLSDATQTRPGKSAGSAATTLVYQVEVHGTDDANARALAARELWERCRRATAALNVRAPLTRLDTDVWAGVIRPALSEHDVMRLSGCLTDATAHRARARVLGESQVQPARREG
ncbi:hypothetical protein [Streptomyces flavofungini]|uniref:Integral membrane protein n=1 Tax=Streptomyces flavofungini TaxID=68200 RepID=A0ABS0XFM2_9ACTN|nr:hypothetical protein [Streptomyces flavofungini]MBJ3810761.1 hypothetical protein [Streptomyces flavofungini]MBJ3812024.1 hypothetical protein [Streptomyces flavofungini]GHC51527.1 hypothetical protein GCM10010349_16690 [Streptomyces flavofungini]